MTAEAPFDLEKPSPIGRLAQLRAAASEAVVRDGKPSHIQQLMAPWGRLEDDLWDAMGESPAMRLLVLTGSAGSGKTATLNHLVTREADTGAGRVGRYLADATHADSPSQQQAQRLAAFFEPFADGADEPDEPCRVIAMNTGMALRFFTELPQVQNAPLLSQLETLLRERLHLPALQGAPAPASWMQESIVVANLDQRTTAGPPNSILDDILTRLDPENPQGVLQGAERCATCRVSDWCWPMANATALAGETARRAINAAVADIALARGRQLAPRSLWDAAAHLALGGLRVDDVEGRDPCFAIADAAAEGDAELLLHALACNGALGPVQIPTDRLKPSRPGSLVDEIAQRDPSYQPGWEVHELIAYAGLDRSADAGLVERCLRGPREVAHPAIRRACNALVTSTSADADRPWGRVLARAAWLGGEIQTGSMVAPEFALALVAQAEGAAEYDGTSLGAALETALATVEEGLAAVFGTTSGPEHFYPTSTPTPGATAELMVSVRLTEETDDLRMATRKDPVPQANPRGVALVGYQPLTVSLEIAGRHVAVDYPLWQLLSAAARGAVPSVLDLERFLALRQAVRAVGARLGGEERRTLLARERGSGGRRFRILSRNTGVLRATEAP